MEYPRKKSFSKELLKQRQKKKPIKIIVVAVIIVLIAVGYALYLHFTSTQQYTFEINSIAVLAFVDMSPEKDQDWFCEGISEGISNALSNVV